MQLRMHTAGIAFMLGGAHAVVDFESDQSPVDRTSGAQVLVEVMAVITGRLLDQFDGAGVECAAMNGYHRSPGCGPREPIEADSIVATDYLPSIVLSGA